MVGLQINIYHTLVMIASMEYLDGAEFLNLDATDRY